MPTLTTWPTAGVAPEPVSTEPVRVPAEPRVITWPTPVTVGAVMLVPVVAPVAVTLVASSGVDAPPMLNWWENAGGPAEPAIKSPFKTKVTFSVRLTTIG